MGVDEQVHICPSNLLDQSEYVVMKFIKIYRHKAT